MKITIICAGKIKEKYLRDAIDEYKKRLQRYCEFNIDEVPDEKTGEGFSESETKAVKDTEGDRILARIPDNAFVFAMDIKGVLVSSEELASSMADNMNRGFSHLVFIIGGSLGLSDKVLSRADKRISFGRITYPHQLFRLVLTEQIYRGFRIMRNEPYHK